MDFKPSCGCEAELSTAQIGLHSTILHRLHPPSAGVKAAGASSVSEHPITDGNGPKAGGGDGN